MVYKELFKYTFFSYIMPTFIINSIASDFVCTQLRTTQCLAFSFVFFVFYIYTT